MHYKKLLFMSLFLSICPNFFLNAEYNSINTDKAYIRAGPGKWYPIKWVIKLKGLPVKIVKENGGYKNILLHDGTKGWVSSILLSKKRTVIVTENNYLLDKANTPIASIMKNVILEYIDCDLKENKNLCRVKINKTKGYIGKGHIWGVN